ncbi:MAG: hypothetical protein NWF01_01905 [Candidatus Bathyarchaeota archaeon]|nr:hypothetical protein [Candidatus Bathyarchaeota archaeon]
MPKSEFLFLQVRAYAIVFVVVYVVLFSYFLPMLFLVPFYGLPALLGIAAGFGASYFAQKKF